MKHKLLDVTSEITEKYMCRDVTQVKQEKMEIKNKQTKEKKKKRVKSGSVAAVAVFSHSARQPWRKC